MIASTLRNVILCVNNAQTKTNSAFETIRSGSHWNAAALLTNKDLRSLNWLMVCTEARFDLLCVIQLSAEFEPSGAL